MYKILALALAATALPLPSQAQAQPRAYAPGAGRPDARRALPGHGVRGAPADEWNARNSLSRGIRVFERPRRSTFAAVAAQEIFEFDMKARGGLINKVDMEIISHEIESLVASRYGGFDFATFEAKEAQTLTNYEQLRGLPSRRDPRPDARRPPVRRTLAGAEPRRRPRLGRVPLPALNPAAHGLDAGIRQLRAEFVGAAPRRALHHRSGRRNWRRPPVPEEGIAADRQPGCARLGLAQQVGDLALRRPAADRPRQHRPAALERARSAPRASSRRCAARRRG